MCLCLNRKVRHEYDWQKPHERQIQCFGDGGWGENTPSQNRAANTNNFMEMLAMEERTVIEWKLQGAEEMKSGFRPQEMRAHL